MLSILLIELSAVMLVCWVASLLLGLLSVANLNLNGRGES